MLYGEKVTLRLFKREDLETYIAKVNDFDMRGDYLPLHINNPMDLQKQFNDNNLMTEDYGRFMIVEKNTDRMLGYIVFFKTTHYMAGLEVGYVIFNKEDHGKGYCSDAMKLITKWLFEAKQINRLQISADSGNVASGKVAEKCGYQKEGILRGAAFSRGEYNDLVMMGMTRADFLAMK